MRYKTPVAMIVAVLAAVSLSHAKAGAAELVMFERAGCSWCARFNKEIAPIYMKTDEGRMAPLRRIDLDQTRPADLAAIDPGVFTPTFVVVDEGREIGRIRGYPGDAFFYGLLDRILTRTSASPDRS